MSFTSRLIANNKLAASRYVGGLSVKPSERLAIVTCMDSRLDVYEILGLKNGQAHILRNAGGIVTDDTIRSLSISQHLLGTNEILLFHHTDCGMQKMSSDEYRQLLTDATGCTPTWDGGFYRDPETDVRESVAKLKASPFILHPDRIFGYVFDVVSGLLVKVA